MLNETPSKSLSSNALKLISIIAMLIDHTAICFIETYSIEGMVLHFIGRLAAPIMCFMIAEGAHYTSNINRYIGRLFLFAGISHFPYVLCFNLTWWRTTSVFWSLALGLVALSVYQNEQLLLWKKAVLIIICCVLAVPGDWSYIAVLWILFFGMFHGQFKKQMLCFAIVGLSLYILPGIISNGWMEWYRLGSLMTIPLLWFYRGRRGAKNKFIKWGFYLFYPVHLVILYILRIFI